MDDETSTLRSERLPARYETSQRSPAFFRLIMSEGALMHSACSVITQKEDETDIDPPRWGETRLNWSGTSAVNGGLGQHSPTWVTSHSFQFGLNQNARVFGPNIPTTRLDRGGSARSCGGICAATPGFVAPRREPRCTQRRTDARTERLRFSLINYARPALFTPPLENFCGCCFSFFLSFFSFMIIKWPYNSCKSLSVFVLLNTQLLTS